MLFFIQNLMQTELSEFSQENGVVKLAVLSINLFLLDMMDIRSAARDPVTMTGYADD
jgi:hypothetical protein